jgi:hypothetical protein
MPHRRACRRDGERGESVKAPRASHVEVIRGVEVIDLRRNARGERAGVEAVDAAHR